MVKQNIVQMISPIFINGNKSCLNFVLVQCNRKDKFISWKHRQEKKMKQIAKTACRSRINEMNETLHLSTSYENYSVVSF